MKYLKLIILVFFFIPNVNSQECIAGDCYNGYGIMKLPNTSINEGFFYNSGTGIGINITKTVANILYTVYKKNKLANPSIFDVIHFNKNKSKIILSYKSNKGLYFSADYNNISNVYIDKEGKTKNLGIIKKTGKSSGCIAGNCESGFGVYKFLNGTLYLGEFKNSRKNGVGYEKYNNGEEYYGEYLNNNRNGYGIYDWAPNSKVKISKYVGQWVVNKMEGKGTYYFGENQFNAGFYKDNKLTELITTTNKN